MSKSALDFLTKKYNISFRKLAHYRQVHTVHYAKMYTVLHFALEGKKTKQTRKTYKEQLFIYNAEQVHNARIKIKTD